jgi:hypothetical protein
MASTIAARRSASTRQMSFHLNDVYGIDATTGLNARKLFCGDMRFVDSKDSHGIQVAHLIASGIRKCLRGEFCDNESVAAALGKMMVQAKRQLTKVLGT